jgi:hypothetical protein
MKNSEIVRKIEAIAGNAWSKSMELPNDEALVYLQDAVDVIRQLTHQVTVSLDRRDAERHRVEL